MESPPPNRAGDPGDPDLSLLLPRLRSQTLAQFDAVSGLLVVNVSQADFLQAFMRWGKKETSDNQLIAAINHETYHYFQTIAAGFPFRRMIEMVRIIADCFRGLGWRFWSPLIGGAKYLDGIIDPVSAIQELERLSELKQRAEVSKDPSLLSALAPQLYPALEALNAAARRPNAHGLSALDLIEGSAIFYQHAINARREDLPQNLEAAWDDHEPSYRRAYDFSRAISGDRTADVILPSIALALRYENPPEALPVFLSRLASAPAGSETAEARAIGRNPPPLPQAGQYLGTAMEFRKNPLCSYPYALYDSTMEELSSGAWGIDEIDLLGDPQASEKVRSFKFGFVTRDGTLFGGSREDIGMRLLLGGVAFRSLGLARYVREAERRLLEQITRQLSP